MMPHHSIPYSVFYDVCSVNVIRHHLVDIHQPFITHYTIIIHHIFDKDINLTLAYH